MFFCWSTFQFLSYYFLLFFLTSRTSKGHDEQHQHHNHQHHHHHQHNHFEENDPLLLDDPRHELRLFAWKFIQSNFVGKYNRILLVRFGPQDLRPTSDHAAAALSLTPFRQSFLVPAHLPEIRNWLRPNLPKVNSADKRVETCQNRLCTALRSSQYDCI